MNLLNFNELVGRDFAKTICKDLEIEFDVDLLSILLSNEQSQKQKFRNAVTELSEVILYRVYENNEELRQKWGEKDFHNLLNDKIEIEPNIAISEEDALYLSDLTGEKLTQYLFTLTKRFENMSKAKSEAMLVAEMLTSGVIAVGVPCTILVIKGLRAGQTLSAAMLAGIKGIGLKTVMVAVVAVLVSLLYYLLWENPKKILGMVINNTDENLIVKDWETGKGDLFMQHGEMVNFMQDNEDGLASDILQLKQRLFFGEGDKDNVVFAGFYFADRNIGFRGSEGVMIFSSKTSNMKFAHMFAVPYVNDNGTNIGPILGSPNLEELYRNLYDHRKVRVDFIEDNYRYTSTVNDPRGGVIGCIASIHKR